MTDEIIVSKSALEDAILEICEPPYYGFENPNTFYNGVDAALRVVKKILAHSQILDSELVGWKYYYKADDCPAINAHDGNCICWHHEGTGKFPNARHDEENTLFEWKLFTTPQPAPDTVPRAEYNKLLGALKTLVELKHQKDTLGKVPTYMDAMPIAWNNARQAIAEAEEKE